MACSDLLLVDSPGTGSLVCDARITLLTVCTIPPLRVALALFGLRPLLARLDRSCRGACVARPLTAARARRVHRLAARAGRVWPGTSCLVVALITGWLLRREGFNAKLRLGVRPSPDGIDAHAWVECAGVALGAPSREGFAPLPAPHLEWPEGTR
jgi:hypothetical protein